MKNEKVFDVRYSHLVLDNGDDLYITDYGRPYLQNILPENFLKDRDWWSSNSTKLIGTSDPYLVKTKDINGRSRDIVFKWNRMGQNVIRDEEDGDALVNAEFNSPFEEFSLVMELRNAAYDSEKRLLTQRPFAVYVPQGKAELWQIGRRDHKMRAVALKHENEVKLDIYREYAVIYEWLKGIDIMKALKQKLIDEDEMNRLNVLAQQHLSEKGFLVRDHKPQHVIVRKAKEGGGLRKDRYGETVYGLVDFELLERTPEREKMVRKFKRRNYLRRQKDRFGKSSVKELPAHLSRVNIMGVDYIFGPAESTGGLLWVVGKDPGLFEYFLPERWEKTERVQLSPVHNIFYTLTRDNVHLVWKLSRVGIIPDMDPFKENEKKALEYGINSPFEEVSIALEMKQKGIRTTYPRAIYMMAGETSLSSSILDESRYISHKELKTPDGQPILQRKHTYTIIWGYWNGPDEKLAMQDSDHLEGINALRALREGMIKEEEYIRLVRRKREKLLSIGIEDMNLKGTHILLSRDTRGALIKDEDGCLETRICNFELLKKI